MEKSIAPKDACASSPGSSLSRFSPLERLLHAGVEQQVARDWLAVRKTKRLAPTETAIDEVLRSIGEAGMSAQEGIRLCCVKGWAGFNAKWIEPEAEQRQPSHNKSAWWATDESVLAKGTELGMHPLAGESMPTFKGRVQAAMDNGGNPVKRTTTGARITQLPAVQKSIKPEGLNLKALVRSTPGADSGAEP